MIGQILQKGSLIATPVWRHTFPNERQKSFDEDIYNNILFMSVYTSRRVEPKLICESQWGRGSRFDIASYLAVNFFIDILRGVCL